MGRVWKFWWNWLMKVWIICGCIVSPTLGDRLYCRSFVDDYPSKLGKTPGDCSPKRHAASRSSALTAQNSDATCQEARTDDFPTGQLDETGTGLIDPRETLEATEPATVSTLGRHRKGLTWHCKQAVLMVCYSEFLWIPEPTLPGSSRLQTNSHWTLRKLGDLSDSQMMQSCGSIKKPSSPALCLRSSVYNVQTKGPCRQRQGANTCLSEMPPAMVIMEAQTRSKNSWRDVVAILYACI